MPFSIHSKRLATSAAILSVALAVAGCGSSSSSGVAHLSTTTGTSPASSEGRGSSPENTTSREQALVNFAKCMRSNGVPNFPDPGSGGRGKVPIGANPAAPLFKAAQAKCQKLLPGGAIPGSEPPSVQTLARWLKISQCMRKHGVFGFPDPRTSIPSKLPAGVGEIADREGAILLIPPTIDQQSPGFTRAAAACGFALTNH